MIRRLKRSEAKNERRAFSAQIAATRADPLMLLQVIKNAMIKGASISWKPSCDGVLCNWSVLAQVRHERGWNWPKWLRISSATAESALHLR